MTEHQLTDFQFRECDTCRAKPGLAKLCSGCLNNRAAIAQFRRHFSAPVPSDELLMVDGEGSDNGFAWYTVDEIRKLIDREQPQLGGLCEWFCKHLNLAFQKGRQFDPSAAPAEDR